MDDVQYFAISPVSLSNTSARCEGVQMNPHARQPDSRGPLAEQQVSVGVFLVCMASFGCRKHSISFLVDVNWVTIALLNVAVCRIECILAEMDTHLFPKSKRVKQPWQKYLIVIGYSQNEAVIGVG
jgi:hypothetical protein